MATVNGGSGNDSLAGTNNADTIRGNGGDDTLAGQDGNDSIRGGTGRDTLYGDAGNDSLYGDEGDDVVYGWTGDDSIEGGSGNDTLVGDQDNDTVRGGDGADWIDGGTGNDSLDGGADNDEIYGSAGSDTITGGAGNDYIDGGTDSDSIRGDGGNDTIFGGAGDDTIDGGSGNDSLFGGAGADSISGGDGNDLIQGEAGNDTIDGGSGADTIRVSDAAGVDQIDGGEGGTDEDVLVFVSSTPVRLTFSDLENGSYAYEGGGGASGTFADIEHFEGGTGQDTLDFSGLSDGISVTYTGDGSGTISDGTDTISFRGIEHIIATENADFIDARANSNDMILEGGDGDDTIYGGFGADSIDGGDGDDWIDSWGTGDDTIDGGSGNDTLEGGAGNDLIIGGSGDDSLTGWTGDDTLQGGAGDDTLKTDVGNDVLDGGNDADTFVLNSNFAGDTIIGGEGGDDYDTIDMSGMSGPVTVTYTGDESGTITNGTDTITFSEIERLILTDYNDSVDASATHEGVIGDYTGVDIDAGDGDDTVIGGRGGDTIDGGAGQDQIEGGYGDDHLAGDGGNDTISGGDGNDTILGGDGSDLIGGGLEADSLSGGGGSDTITGDNGNDTINGGAGTDNVDGGSGNDYIAEENLLVNGGLEAGVPDGGMSTTRSVDGWQTDGSGFETWGSGHRGVESDDGGGFVEIDRFAGEQDNLYQDVQTDAGQAYSISFDAAGRPGDSMWQGIEVYWNGSLIDTVRPGDPTFETYSYTVTGTGGSDRLEFREVAGEDDALGPLLDNVSLTTADDDTLSGGSGDDTISGGGGDDSLSGGDGDDNVSGGAGDDTLSGGAGNDAFSGSTGRDSIDGGDGNDVIDAGADDDTVDGGSGNDTINGSRGNDVLTGGNGDDTFEYTLGDGSDTITDFNSGNTGTLNDGDGTNNDSIDLSGFYDSVFELHADQADDGVLNQSNTTGPNSIDYSNNNQFASGEGITFQGASADNSSFTSENTGVACFTTGTAVRTPSGDVLIDELRVGDLVTTMDNGPQRISWIGQRHVTQMELLQNDSLHPVLIKKGVLGAKRELLVSRQHAMLLGQDYFGRAVHLAETMPGIRVAKGKRQVTFVHLMFEAHQIIFAEGIPSESFYPGPIALEMLSSASREEICLTVPTLTAATRCEDIIATYGNTARVFLENKKAVSAWLSVGTESVEKEISKWDLDLAMEQVEAERMFRAATPYQICGRMPQVAKFHAR